MTSQRFIIAFVQGTAEELNRTEDTYDFLYNSLLEKAASEGRAQS